MRLELIQLPAFVAKWSKLRLTDDDLRSLEGLVLVDPESGDLIPGTGGLHKLRFAPPSRRTGQRGACRVIYAFIAAGEAVYFFTLYLKNQQSDLSGDEKKVFRQVLERLHQRYEAERNR